MARIQAQQALPAQYADAKTSESLTFTIDSGAGSDPDPSTGPYTTQAQITAHGSFASDGGALAMLPEKLRHSVVLEFVDGAYSVTGFARDELLRFDFGYKQDTLGHGSIEYASANAPALVSGTAVMDVASATATTVTVTPDPALTTDAYAGYHLAVVAGTGSGQKKVIRNHTGAVFTVAGRFAPAPDATSDVRIEKASASLDLATGFLFLQTSETQEFGHDGDENIKFRDIDITKSTGGYIYVFTSTRFYGACRIDGCEIRALDSANLTMGGSVAVDCQGLRGSVGGVVVTRNASFKVEDSNSSVLIRDSTGPGVWVSGNADLFKMAVDDNAGDGILVSGGELQNETQLEGEGNGGYGVSLALDGTMILNVTDLPGGGETLTGTSGDCGVDGTAYTWAAIDADPDNSVVGPNSRVLGYVGV